MFPITGATMAQRWSAPQQRQLEERATTAFPLAMTPEHPNHHSLRPRKDTQERPATILSIPASPRRSGKEKAMPSTVYTVIKSAYKTFQANPRMATLPTSKAHTEATPHHQKPHRQISSVHQLSVRPSAGGKTTRHTQTLLRVHHATTPKQNRTPQSGNTWMSHTHFRNHLISSSN